MQWSPIEFELAVGPQLVRYRAADRWFRWSTNDDELIRNAWQLYKCANQNELGFLLLGDAKIRSGNLLMNFGLASGNGIDDAREIRQIDEVRARRRGLAPPGHTAVEPLGPGSILNDKSWTPLLNDAFILGGVHSRQDFHWAEEGFSQHRQTGEQEFLQKRAVFGAAAPQYQAALRRDEAYYKGLLQHYLLGQQNFWSAGVVRIFARELLGLKQFGYSFVITGQALSFAPGGAGTVATFKDYLDGLSGAGYFGGDPGPIKAALSEFLFGDGSALSGLQAGQAASKPQLKNVPKPPGWPS